MKTGSLVTFVEVPEEEEFAATRCGGADVTKQVDAGIPEHAVEAQHHLRAGSSTAFKVKSIKVVVLIKSPMAAGSAHLLPS